MSDDWYQYDAADLTSIERQTFAYEHYKLILFSP